MFNEKSPSSVNNRSGFNFKFKHALIYLLTHAQLGLLFYFMKLYKLRIYLAFFSITIAVQHINGAPLVTIGDIGTISFTGNSTIKWDSNIFRQETREVSDTLLVFSPGFSAVLGRNVTDLDIGLSTSYDINRYQDNDDLDSELLSLRANAAYRTSRLELAANASYVETKSNNELANRAGALLERELTAYGINGEYTLSPKFSVKAGVNWDEIAYVGDYAASYSDREYLKLPVDIYYELTPKMGLSVGYVYGQIDVESAGQDATTNNFNVGLRGELLPKLVGYFKVGYNQYEHDNAARDTASMSLDSNLTWTVSAKFTHRLNIHRNFDASATGTGTEESKLNWSTSYALNNKVSLSGRAGYSIRDYLASERKDKLLTLGLNGTYRINRYWNLNAGYVFSNNDSNNAGSSYDDNIVTFAASLTY